MTLESEQFIHELQQMLSIKWTTGFMNIGNWTTDTTDMKRLTFSRINFINIFLFQNKMDIEADRGNVNQSHLQIWVA